METESSLAVPKETRRAALDGLLQLPTSRRMVEGLGLAFEALGLAPAALRPEDAAAMVSAWQRGLTVVLELSPLNPSDPAVERLVMRELLSGRWHRVTAEWARRGVEFRDFARAISAARAVVQRELERGGQGSLAVHALITRVLDLLIEAGSEAWGAELARQQREVQDRLMRL